MRRFLFFLPVLLGTTMVSAQPVYETHDREGPVFSDMPGPGAKPLSLPPVNLMDGVPKAPAVAAQPASAAAYTYATLQIMQPQDGGTMHSNTGQIDIVVALDPTLRTDRGDAIAVKLDGTVLPTKRVTPQFELSPDEWQMAGRDQDEHQLEVAVVDRAGRALLISAPVHFFVHRATRR
ncbi:MAG: hypothetical protein JNK99_17440 [Candidatus Accumulibacter sp.]|uniref:hypothetical protein n=1 Tax=Accumulibacter sp. TaxID=2053492 RepID=UPI001A5F86B6|nr:hypothetical protein [Accumulibacter sp.]MBL8396500.1 hypothetical protein [Accumulibacter sp.]